MKCLVTLVGWLISMTAIAYAQTPPVEPPDPTPPHITPAQKQIHPPITVEDAKHAS